VSIYINDQQTLQLFKVRVNIFQFGEYCDLGNLAVTRSSWST